MRISFRLFMVASLILVTGVSYAQQYALDHFYIAPPPPETSAKLLQTRKYPLAESTVRSWVAQSMPNFSLEPFDPENTATKQLLMDAPPHQVAINRTVDIEAADLFDSNSTADDNVTYIASVSSSGAYALRLQVNLMGLRQGDVLWVLDAKGDAAFGPYTLETAQEDGQWLPVTLGESVVLALESADAVLPLLTIQEVAHFYKPIIEKQLPAPLSCNIPIAQETNTTVQEISAAVGRMLVPFSNGQGLCTTTLLNSEKRMSGAPTPYIISAWHCFGDGVDYSSLTVYWDYRSPNTDGNDVPSLYDLEWNIGATLLDHSFPLDHAFLQLSSQVAVGTYGRAWVGWDSASPAQGTSVQVIHHPVGADLKTSKGRITSDATDVCMNVTCSQRYDMQIEVLWSEGVTEQGSSGSALLARSNSYRLAGVLSNGTTHSCTDPSNNFDNFGPFHAFFPQIGCYLLNDYVCAEPYESESGGCFLFKKGYSVELLQNLRSFRDNTLLKTAVGQQITTEYYKNAGLLEKWIDDSMMTRFLFDTLLTFGGAWGASGN